MSVVLTPTTTSTYGTAVCLSSDAVGDFVYVSGAKSGLDWTVTKADPAVYAKMPAVAVIVSKLTSTRALIQFSGEVAVFSGLTPGRLYWLGSAGPQLLPPTGSSRLYWQSVGVATATTTLALNPSSNLSVHIE